MDKIFSLVERGIINFSKFKKKDLIEIKNFLVKIKELNKENKIILDF